MLSAPRPVPVGHSGAGLSIAASWEPCCCQIRSRDTLRRGRTQHPVPASPAPAGALALPHLLAPGPRCGLCRCGAMGFSPSLCSPHPHAPDHVTSRTPLLAAAFLDPCLCQGSPESLRWWKACHVYEGGLFPGIDLCGMGGRIGVTHKADSHTLRDSKSSLSPRTVSRIYSLCVHSP